MNYDEMLDKIKEQPLDGGKGKMSIEALGKKFGVKNRQTVYKYIQYYVSDQRDKIPDGLCRYFNEIASAPAVPADTLRIDSIEKCRYALAVIDEEIERMECDSRIFGDEPEYIEQMRQLQLKRENLLKMYEEMKAEKAEARAEDIRRNGLGFEPVDEILRKGMEAGGFSGPRWTSSRSGVGTVCVADDGDYMVIVDDDVGDKAGKELLLYAVIGGVRKHIATYGFEPGKAFVRFSLIPKLSYLYEVRYFGNDDGWTSGVLELRNFERLR